MLINQHTKCGSKESMVQKIQNKQTQDLNPHLGSQFGPMKKHCMGKQNYFGLISFGSPLFKSGVLWTLSVVILSYHNSFQVYHAIVNNLSKLCD